MVKFKEALQELEQMYNSHKEKHSRILVELFPNLKEKVDQKGMPVMCYCGKEVFDPVYHKMRELKLHQYIEIRRSVLIHPSQVQFDWNDPHSFNYYPEFKDTNLGKDIVNAFKKIADSAAFSPSDLESARRKLSRLGTVRFTLDVKRSQS